MQFFQLLALVMAAVAAAKGNDKTGNKTLSTKVQCNQMAKLQALVDAANNATLLAKLSHNNATRAGAIQAKATEAASTLSTMESNTTLVSACNAVFAVDRMQQSCGAIAQYESLKAISDNSTRLSEVTKNNATRASALQARVSTMAAKVAGLQSNNTLTTFCAAEQTKAHCAAISDMQKTVAKASNTTYLKQRFKNNTTKISSFQAHASKLQTKLSALQSNTTLATACTNNEKTTTGNAATSASSSSSSKGAAGMVQPMAGAVSLASLLLAGVLLL